MKCVQGRTLGEIEDFAPPFPIPFFEFFGHNPSLELDRDLKFSRGPSPPTPASLLLPPTTPHLPGPPYPPISTSLFEFFGHNSSLGRHRDLVFSRRPLQEQRILLLPPPPMYPHISPLFFIFMAITPVWDLI